MNAGTAAKACSMWSRPCLVLRRGRRHLVTVSGASARLRWDRSMMFGDGRLVAWLASAATMSDLKRPWRVPVAIA